MGQVFPTLNIFEQCQAYRKVEKHLQHTPLSIHHSILFCSRKRKEGLADGDSEYLATMENIIWSF